MNKLTPFLALALIGLIYSCANNAISPRQSPVMGTWKLQSQHTVEFINDTPRIITNSTTSDFSKPTITFGSNGTYTATAVFSLRGALITLGQPDSSGFIGNYSTSGDSLLIMKPFFIGALWLDTAFVPAKAIMFSNTIVAEKAIIQNVSPSVLTFETDIDVLQTADNKTRTITTNTSYTYTR